jgi:hypothetical protein
LTETIATITNCYEKEKKAIRGCVFITKLIDTIQLRMKLCCGKHHSMTHRKNAGFIWSGIRPSSNKDFVKKNDILTFYCHFPSNEKGDLPQFRSVFFATIA